MPVEFVATLDEFFIDRFEVTNEEFLEFVRAGGYDDARYWTEFDSDAERVEALASFVDLSGRPGPRGWSDGTYPDGQARYPVTGVTWHEAAAYAAFRGRSLLTLHQWEKAARDGAFNVFDDIVLPWGMVRTSDVSSDRVRSFAAAPGPVDEHPFGQSVYGVYAMAGNAKEWLSNRHGEGRAVAGGSWQDPLYLFSAVGGHEPLYSASTLGFRTAWLDPDRRRLSQDQGLITLDTLGITPVYDHVDRATLNTFLTHYRYDRKPANAEILETVETDDWVREKIAFDGPEEERILSYLYLPRRSAPPHQPVLFVPGGSVFFGVEVTAASEAIATPLVQTGRAVFVVVMKGMTGRDFDEDRQSPELMSVAFRDLIVLHATEMRMGLDYLETRTDLAMDRLAYMGWSRGSASRLAFAAVDDRFRGVVLAGGGIDERWRPVLPEIDPVNFAPHIDVPTILINGRQDEEHPWLTRALPLWNLLSQPKKLVLIEGAGHRPRSDQLIPPVEEFLDKIP
jgi:dienelactone hydrolase